MSVEKAIKQHIEMENFLSGGFAVKGKDFPLTSDKFEDKDMAVQNAAQELAKIAAEVQKCCKCGLGESRTNAVPGEGNPNAELVFVGEAPGADEDQQGRPFIGRAGKLLDDIIAA
ncbi:MAG: uracil-DNA glycosylase family protein, partial [Phycisphaerae bacterium]|nr:uracil-DNA glycosylase family protein [Phycisphaerae bacterium]